MAATKAQIAQKKQEKKKNVRLFWKLVFTGLGMVVLLFLLTAWGVFGSLPDHTILENPQSELATEIVTSDGKTLGSFYTDRKWTLSDWLI